MGWFRHKDDEEELEETKRLVQYAAELHGVSSKDVLDTVLDDDRDYDDDDDDDFYDKPSKWWGPGVWATFVFVGGIFGLGISGLIWLSHMTSGPTASSGVTAFNASVAPTPLGNQTFLSPLLVFSYPGEFNNIATEANWPNTTERYMIGSSTDYRRSISIMIENNMAQPSDDSGYAFRNEPGSAYTQQSTVVSGTPAVVMIKSDDTERTLYWEHAGMLVVMSVVSTNGTDNVEQIMATIVHSLRWRTTS